MGFSIGGLFRPKKFASDVKSLTKKLLGDPSGEDAQAALAAENAATRAFLEKQSGIARGDVQRLFPEARTDIERGTEEAISALRAGGGPASDIQAALSGALGPEAQQQAFVDFQQDPGQQFLQEQGEQSVLKSQAAIGGLGGGNVRRALTRFGTGLAQQGLQQRIQNLGTLAGREETRGVNISNLLAGRGTQQAGQKANLATILANIATQQGSQVAGLPSPSSRLTGQGLLKPIAEAASGIGTAIAASDIRLKTNIQRTGQTPFGINLYTWDWTDEAKNIVGDQPTFGVMAQEVMNITPEAVMMHEDGFYRVDYVRIH